MSSSKYALAQPALITPLPALDALAHLQRRDAPKPPRINRLLPIPTLEPVPPEAYVQPQVDEQAVERARLEFERAREAYDSALAAQLPTIAGDDTPIVDAVPAAVGVFFPALFRLIGSALAGVVIGKSIDFVGARVLDLFRTEAPEPDPIEQLSAEVARVIEGLDQIDMRLVSLEEQINRQFRRLRVELQESLLVEPLAKLRTQWRRVGALAAKQRELMGPLPEDDWEFLPAQVLNNQTSLEIINAVLVAAGGLSTTPLLEVWVDELLDELGEETSPEELLDGLKAYEALFLEILDYELIAISLVTSGLCKGTALDEPCPDAQQWFEDVAKPLLRAQVNLYEQQAQRFATAGLDMTREQLPLEELEQVFTRVSLLRIVILDEREGVRGVILTPASSHGPEGTTPWRPSTDAAYPQQPGTPLPIPQVARRSWPRVVEMRDELMTGPDDSLLRWSVYEWALASPTPELGSPLPNSEGNAFRPGAQDIRVTPRRYDIATFEEDDQGELLLAPFTDTTAVIRDLRGDIAPWSSHFRHFKQKATTGFSSGEAFNMKVSGGTGNFRSHLWGQSRFFEFTSSAEGFRVMQVARVRLSFTKTVLLFLPSAFHFSAVSVMSSGGEDLSHEIAAFTAADPSSGREYDILQASLSNPTNLRFNYVLKATVNDVASLALEWGLYLLLQRSHLVWVPDDTP